MAEQKKLPSESEILRLKELVKKTGDKSQMSRADDLYLKVKNKKPEDSLIKSTGVTGEAGKELFKMAKQDDQMFKVKVGKPEVVKDITQKISNVTPTMNSDRIRVGSAEAKDIWGSAAKKAASQGVEGLGDTVANKAGKFLKKGRLAGVGAFLTGLHAALSGEQANAGEMAAGAAEALAPAGVSEALQSESLGPSTKSKDITQRAAAKLEGGFKLSPEEQAALDEQKRQNDLEMQKYRVK